MDINLKNGYKPFHPLLNMDDRCPGVHSTIFSTSKFENFHNKENHMWQKYHEEHMNEVFTLGLEG